MMHWLFFCLFQDQLEISPNCSFDGSSGLSGLMSPVKGQTGTVSQATDSVHLPMVNTSYASSGEYSDYSSNA